ncbi:MAG: aromatic ring-hydroxylating dioxygenase subunit alpha [Hyphomicrobiales bacterium]
MLNLDSRLYVSDDVLDLERRSIFWRTWQLLGPASALAEKQKYLAADIAGLGVFAIRGRDDVLRAFKNVCRHRGARLLEVGEGSCNVIRCPYHQWAFSDTGRLVHAPWFGTDPAIIAEDWPLEEIKVDTWRGLVFVSVDPTESLLDQLGDLVEEIADEPIETYHATDTARVEFDANWKVYTDNFVEGYHIPGTHPAFYRAIDFEEFKTTAHKGFVRMTAPPKNGLFYRGKWLWMWPNWTLSLFAGGMNTSRINPIGVGRTEQLYTFHFADASAEKAKDRRQTIEANLAVVREDCEVCLATHKNYVAGAYKPGPLSNLHEKGVYYFQQKVRESLGL